MKKSYCSIFEELGDVVINPIIFYDLDLIFRNDFWFGIRTTKVFVRNLTKKIETIKYIMNKAEKIVNWLKEYAIKNNIKALIIGVSGGVDSALVSTLCAMTGLKTECVILPCYSKSEEIDRALNHCKWLEKKFNNVHHQCLYLSSTFKEFQYEMNYNSLNSDLGYANSKSRLRMVALYHIATIHNGLVVGTGNKIEDFGVGFFTKYGDGGVDISPIGDMFKSEVREMARQLGILPELTEAIPTDGLWGDGRTDELQLKATYDELQKAMEFCEKNPDLLNSNFDSSKLLQINNLLSKREIEVIQIYINLHKKTLHKLLPIPVYKEN